MFNAAAKAAVADLDAVSEVWADQAAATVLAECRFVAGPVAVGLIVAAAKAAAADLDAVWKVWSVQAASNVLENACLLRRQRRLWLTWMLFR